MNKGKRAKAKRVKRRKQAAARLSPTLLALAASKGLTAGIWKRRRGLGHHGPASEVRIIDPATGETVGTIPVGRWPSNFDPDPKRRTGSAYRIRAMRP